MCFVEVEIYVVANSEKKKKKKLPELISINFQIKSWITNLCFIYFFFIIHVMKSTIYTFILIIIIRSIGKTVDYRLLFFLTIVTSFLLFD